MQYIDACWSVLLSFCASTFCRQLSIHRPVRRKKRASDWKRRHFALLPTRQLLQVYIVEDLHRIIALHNTHNHPQVASHVRRRSGSWNAGWRRQTPHSEHWRRGGWIKVLSLRQAHPADSNGTARLLLAQDTITGLLLAGTGHISEKGKKNFLVVDSSVLWIS